MEDKKICKQCGRALTLEQFYSPKSEVCRSCARRNGRAHKGEGNPALATFTPRELLLELRTRGYRGTLTVTQEVKL